jgi:hypothetical protein
MTPAISSATYFPFRKTNWSFIFVGRRGPPGEPAPTGASAHLRLGQCTSTHRPWARNRRNRQDDQESDEVGLRAVRHSERSGNPERFRGRAERPRIFISPRPLQRRVNVSFPG